MQLNLHQLNHLSNSTIVSDSPYTVLDVVNTYEGIVINISQNKTEYAATTGVGRLKRAFSFRLVTTYLLITEDSDDC